MGASEWMYCLTRAAPVSAAECVSSAPACVASMVSTPALAWLLWHHGVADYIRNVSTTRHGRCLQAPVCSPCIAVSAGHSYMRGNTSAIPQGVAR